MPPSANKWKWKEGKLAGFKRVQFYSLFHYLHCQLGCPRRRSTLEGYSSGGGCGCDGGGGGGDDYLKKGKKGRTKLRKRRMKWKMIPEEEDGKYSLKIG